MEITIKIQIYVVEEDEDVPIAAEEVVLEVVEISKE